MTVSLPSKILTGAALCLIMPGAGMAAFEFIPAPAPAAPPAIAATPPASNAFAVAPAPVETANRHLTPAPASEVVSEALASSRARVSPQSILPPAQPVASQARVPAAPYPTPLAVAAPAALNMNPLATAAGRSQAAQLEQAMVQGGLNAPAPIYTPASSVARVTHDDAGALSAPASSYADAVGFGRDLPLALAVGQIVPPDYAFNFSPSVNPGDTVSWEGGKPWDRVLNETLAGIGASARIDAAKKEIAIVSGGAQAASFTPPPAQPVAPAPMAAMPAVYTPVAPAPRPPSPSLAGTPLYTEAPVAAPAPAPVPAFIPAVAPVPAAQAAPSMPLIGISGTSVLDTKAKRLWEAERGNTLRGILTDWSMQAGVELFWSSDFDFPVESAVRINGTFEEAVQTVLRGLRDAQPRPIGRLHPNLPDGPSVLVIETKHVLE